MESLFPVVEAWLALGPEREAVVTVFSASGLANVRAFSGSSERSGFRKQLICSGLSPREGDWAETLAQARIDAFVTAKYEAWPELWAALGEQGVPLLVVSAQVRSSLAAAKQVLRLAGKALPTLYFAAVNEGAVGPLLNAFPGARVCVGGEPRWDRVAARLKRAKDAAGIDAEKLRRCPKPWGILGSAWLSDLEVVVDGWAREKRGTLFVFPHEVDEVNARHQAGFLADRLEREGLAHEIPFLVWRRGDQQAIGPVQGARIVLVPQKGFLTEFYDSAEWVFVGGGFGPGVHSTIEPALAGKPIACGPRGTEKFPEVSVLIESGQLRVCRDDVDFARWLTGLRGGKDGAREGWNFAVERQRGSTQKILALLQTVVDSGA